MRRPWTYTLAALLILAAEAPAQSPRIDSILARPVDRRLAVNLQLSNIFSPKTVGTIRSGLPAVIRFDFRLIEESNRDVERLTRTLEILYDLWNERYRIRYDNQVRYAETFADMEKFCSDFEESNLLPLSRLAPQKSYRLRVQVAVVPISAKQDQQLRDWLEASGTTEESAPGEERSSSFRLNFSKLLSFFLRKKQRPFGTSEWATSPPFRVE